MKRIIDDSIEITDQGKNTVPAVGSLGADRRRRGEFSWTSLCGFRENVTGKIDP